MQCKEHQGGAIAKEKRCTAEFAEEAESTGEDVEGRRKVRERRVVPADPAQLRSPLVREMQGRIPEAAGGQELNGEKTRVDTEQLSHAGF